MSNTPQGEAIEGNAADDALMVNQGFYPALDLRYHIMISLNMNAREGEANL